MPRAAANIAPTAPEPRALARRCSATCPSPCALRLALLGVAVGGFVALAVLALTVRVLSGAIGVFSGKRLRPAVLTANVFSDGRDGFSDLALRAVARSRR